MGEHVSTRVEKESNVTLNMPSEPFFSHKSKVEAGFLVGKWFGTLTLIGTSARLIGIGGKFRLGTFSRRLLEKHPFVGGPSPTRGGLC
jgi:hypothetical protein